MAVALVCVCFFYLSYAQVDKVLRVNQMLRIEGIYIYVIFIFKIMGQAVRRACDRWVGNPAVYTAGSAGEGAPGASSLFPTEIY